jgi:hypothetical protein
MGVRAKYLFFMKKRPDLSVRAFWIGRPQSVNLTDNAAARAGDGAASVRSKKRVMLAKDA